MLCSELQKIWQNDKFLKLGGDQVRSRRPNMGYSAIYSSVHKLNGALGSRLTSSESKHRYTFSNVVMRFLD